MSKPTLKSEVAIDMIFPAGCFITLYATTDAASEFSEFGDIHAEGKDRYHLSVDARYDFDEVVAYIRNYNDNPATPAGLGTIRE